MIDLRSDTVTRPTAAMKQAMVDAPLGDDVFGDDPTVQRLEAMVAERLNKEAAVFVTSGTQSNLLALMSHCGRGDEYIVGDQAHCYGWEGGGAAVLGSIQPQVVPMLADGLPDPAAIANAVKPEDPHFARTKVVCLENTKDGIVQSVARMEEATDVARAHGLATHLDGARMWNAAVALSVENGDAPIKNWKGVGATEFPLAKSLTVDGGEVKKLVTKKNKKLKRLRAIHPDINCKLFYQRDYLNLVVKYGLEEPDHLEDVAPPARIPGRPEITRLEDRGERLTG